MKTDVNDITKEDFKTALETILNGKVTTLAPFGYSGDHLYLYKKSTEGVSWSGCVTMRTWSDIPELLIGNKAGKWLCHMQIDRILGFDYILNEFYRQFENVKHLIDRFDKDEANLELAHDAKYSAGFAILHEALKKSL